MSRLVATLRVGIGLAIALSLWLASAANAADLEAGKRAYAVCAACHGPEGQGNVAMNAPRIAGQEPWYVKRQMEAFQQGLRGAKPGDGYGMQMAPMAKAVTDPAALDNLVAYVASLPDVPAEPTVEGDAAAGGKTYAACAACHGPRGEGVEAMGGPRLAGQSDWYLARQIRNYQQNLRGYDSKDIFGNQMKPMASMLADDKAINDVVAYLNTLR